MPDLGSNTARLSIIIKWDKNLGFFKVSLQDILDVLIFKKYQIVPFGVKLKHNLSLNLASLHRCHEIREKLAASTVIYLVY